MESISWQADDGTRWIELEGDLDSAVGLELKGRFDEAVAAGDGDVAVLMRGVTFLSSTAAGLLVNAHQELAAQGRNLRLEALQPKVRRAIELMALDGFFGLAP